MWPLFSVFLLNSQLLIWLFPAGQLLMCFDQMTVGLEKRVFTGGENSSYKYMCVYVWRQQIWCWWFRMRWDTELTAKNKALTLSQVTLTVSYRRDIITWLPTVCETAEDFIKSESGNQCEKERVLSECPDLPWSQQRPLLLFHCLHSHN